MDIQGRMKLNKLKILLIDDNHNIRNMMSTILLGGGVSEVRETASCVEALSLLREPGGWKPNFLLVDYMVGTLNGIQFTRMVREEIDTPDKRLPIILITGYFEQSVFIEAMAAGVDDLVAKPFASKTLIRRIAQTIDLHRHQGQPAPQIAGAGQTR